MEKLERVRTFHRRKCFPVFWKEPSSQPATISTQFHKASRWASSHARHSPPFFHVRHTLSLQTAKQDTTHISISRHAVTWPGKISIRRLLYFSKGAWKKCQFATDFRCVQDSITFNNPTARCLEEGGRFEEVSRQTFEWL